jgi:hypothetical protein
MRTGSSLFYSNEGKGRRIFECQDSLVQAIRDHTAGSRTGIGDCSDLVAEVDPFDDGQGASRLGMYLQWCLNGFEAGMEREEVIVQANELYAAEWGHERVCSNEHNREH